MSEIAGGFQLSLRDQTLSLLPQRAIFWHEQKTLVVADVHLGKAQTFQRAGLGVPDATFYHDLERLETLVRITAATRLLVLGDFVHHRSGLTQAVIQRIAQWCESINAQITVVLGNHDLPNRKLLAELPLDLCEHSWCEQPFCFSHDEINTHFFSFVGHVHPVVNLRPSLRLPAFAFYNNRCVLPAFSYFTGGSPLDRNELGQKLFVAVDEQCVLPLQISAVNSASVNQIEQK